MELIIGLAVALGLLWFFFFREKDTNTGSSQAPYKVETPVEEPAKVVEPAKVEEVKVEIQAAELTDEPVVQAKPKKTAKAKPAKTAKTASAMTTKASSAKPKAAKKPRMTVAK